MDLNKIMSSLAGSGVLGGLAGGAVSGALISNKKARKTAGNVLKIGGLAALGGMAWKAYQGYQTQQAASTTAADTAAGSGLPTDPVWQDLKDTGFDIEATDDSRGSRSLLLIRAMIAAACADGHLDRDERARILQQLGTAELSADEKGLVFDALSNPPSLVELSQWVDCPELAAEVYMASLLAIDHDRVEARLYLDALAYRLGLPEALVSEMHSQLPAPTKAVA